MNQIMNKEVYVKPGQNITDICLQEYGSLENLLLLHKENGFETIPVNVESGTKIIIPEAPIIKNITTFFSLNKPATSKDTSQLKQGGIDFMGIEIDFIVS